jgi:Gcd10p family
MIPRATPSATEMMVRDPLIRSRPSATVRDGDFVLLHFGDGRQIFARCQAGKKCTVRINKKVYSTNNLVGIPYGTVLEQEQTQLVALPANAKLIPEFPAVATRAEDDTTNFDTDDNNNQVTTTATTSLKDNRWLVDTNTAQQLDQQELWRMREDGVAGAEIVASIIENSSTFDQKTAYSKAKYVVRKQKKYQPRCRIVRCNGATISEALYLKDPRKVMNLREDTLAQILSYANVSAGCQTIVLESCMGIVTGAIAQRMICCPNSICLLPRMHPSSGCMPETSLRMTTALQMEEQHQQLKRMIRNKRIAIPWSGRAYCNHIHAITLKPRLSTKRSALTFS